LRHKYEQFERLAFERCIVVTNKKNHENITAVIPPEKLHVSYVCQDGQGQGNAILAAETFLTDDPILIVNASDWYDDNILLPYIEETQHPFTIGAVRTETYFPGGYLVLDGDGCVSKIIEKPQIGKEPSDIVRIVIDKIERPLAFCEHIKKYRDDALGGYEQALISSISSGLRCKAIITDLPWIPIKYPWHVLDVAQKLLLSLKGQVIATDSQIKPGVVLDGPIVIESGVRIFEGVKIVGPAYIGKNSIIGNNTMIRQSILGDNCVTGYASDITRSVIGNNCWFHTNYIGDSVLSDNISMGSGAVFANLRLDDGQISMTIKGEKIVTGRNKLGAIIGSDTRIGINVSVMPGVAIGSNTFISSGIAVQTNIPDESFVKPLSIPYEVVKNKLKASSSRDEFKSKL